MLKEAKKWRKNDTNKKGKGDMSRAMKSINARAARRRVVVAAVAVGALYGDHHCRQVSRGDQKAMRTEVVSTPSKGRRTRLVLMEKQMRINLTRDKEEEEEEEEEEETMTTRATRRRNRPVAQRR